MFNENLKAEWHRRHRGYFRFIDKRIPPSNIFHLTHKQLFIFPTFRGFIFLAIIATLWVLGTNYQNNLILALVFFMVSIFIIAILYTFQNLNHLLIKVNGLKGDAFQGQPLQYTFAISSKHRQFSESVEVAFQSDLSRFFTINYVDEQTQKFSLFHLPIKRGWQYLPRVRIQSHFPLGILRCWTWLSVDSRVCVFPNPKEGECVLTLHSTEEPLTSSRSITKGQDYSGLKRYVSGDAIRRISWKSSAKGRGFFVKEFTEGEGSENWIHFMHVNAHGVDEKLSVMAFLVLYFHQENNVFGLILPNQKIEPNTGTQHRHRCLTALAEYESGH